MYRYTNIHMKLIIGLGNPEEKYTNTRHNVGFAMLGQYAAKQGATFQLKDRFKARIAELTLDSEKTLLVLPMTYYNNSGEAVRAMCDFYKITPDNVLIIHDELALPFGTVRIRIGGSDAGNNGVKSVNTHIGEGTARIRIGIKNEHHDNDVDFVLGKFNSDESKKLEQIQEHVTKDIAAFISNTFEATTHSH